MGYRYAVLGAGRQGCAAAYDLARFGEADEIALLDRDRELAVQAAGRINTLADRSVARPVGLDASDPNALAGVLPGMHAALSALPYPLNPASARASMEAGCSFCDVGGNTAIVQQELRLHEAASSRGVSVVPDCGLAPGMANMIAVAGMSRLDPPLSVRIWCGGLPRAPLPPLGYKLLFNPVGLVNEYTGEAVMLRAGKITFAPALSEEEEIEFPSPVGRCEAFLTSGGTSTCPWTFEGRLETYEYKTVRYPGHLAQIRTLEALGLLAQKPLSVGGHAVVPRELTQAVLSERLHFPGEPDLVVLRVRVAGRRGGRSHAVVFDLLDHSDPATGFSAMERCTGFPAAIVAWMQARGEIAPGARPQEVAVPPGRFLEELGRRGILPRETGEAGGR